MVTQVKSGMLKKNISRKCLFSALILFLLFPKETVSAENLPASLAAAIERVEAGEANPTRISLLRRHANSDQVSSPKT